MIRPHDVWADYTQAAVQNRGFIAGILLFITCLGCMNGDDAAENTTMEDDRYVLVLVEDAADRQVLEERATIVHSASSRLYVVRLGPGTRNQINSVAGVIAVTDKVFPDDIARQLDSKEALFAAAFAARGTKKDRVGNGLPWDAPDFEPPDSSAGSTASQLKGGRNDDK